MKSFYLLWIWMCLFGCALLRLVSQWKPFHIPHISKHCYAVEMKVFFYYSCLNEWIGTLFTVQLICLTFLSIPSLWTCMCLPRWLVFVKTLPHISQCKAFTLHFLAIHVWSRYLKQKYLGWSCSFHHLPRRPTMDKCQATQLILGKRKLRDETTFNYILYSTFDFSPISRQ